MADRPNVRNSQSDRILALARQLADDAAAGLPYAATLRELVLARRIEVYGHR